MIAQRQRFDQLFGSAVERSARRSARSAGLSASQANPAQRRVNFIGAAGKYDPKQHAIASDVYKRQVAALDQIDPVVDVSEGNTGSAEATYTPIAGELSGNIEIGPLQNPPSKPNQRLTEFNSNVGSMTHEMQHALDDLTRAVKYRQNNVNVLHTEWRAWAIQAAVTLEMHRARQPVSPYDFNIMKCFVDKKTLSTPGNAFFRKTAIYLKKENVIANPSDQDVVAFMYMHTDWLGDALQLFYSNVPEGIGGLRWDLI